MSGWTALRIRIPQSLEEPILLILHEAGTLGVEIDDGTAPPAKEEDPAPARGGSGRGDRFATSWFPEGADLRPAKEALARLDGSIWIGRAEVEDGRWVERQESDRRPLVIGRSFLVAPDAAASSPRGEPRIVLVIPAKRAFGTGEHATTRLCLELLETLTVRGLDVLDFGTGSGILAFAAAALGAETVLAIDDDPEAIEMARENAELNARAFPPGRVRLAEGSLAEVAGRYDLVVANIYAGVLEQAAPRLAELQPPGGRAILSGFSPREAIELAGVWERAGYARVVLREAGEWAALVMEIRR